MDVANKIKAAADAFRDLAKAYPKVACPRCRRMMHPVDVPPTVFPAHTNSRDQLCTHSGEHVTNMDRVV